MQLVNLKTGTPEDLGDDKVLESLAAGTHAPAGAKALINPSGELVFSPLEDVQNNLSQYGYAVPTQAQLTELANQRQYGEGTGNAVKAGLEGAARGASFGLSDLAESKLLGVDPAAIRERQTRNPISSTTGEIAGAVGSALLAPEASPAGLISKLGGSVAERLAPEALGEGASLASRVLNATGQVGAKAAGSAVEGAAYGLGQTVSEAALGDPDLSGEKVLANIGYGGLFGGALGGLLKTGELAIPKSIQAAKDTIDNVYAKLIGGGEDEVGILGKAYAAVSSKASGEPEEQILDAIKNRQNVEVLNPKERADIAREFKDTLEEHYSAVNKASSDASTLARPQESAALLADADPAKAMGEYQAVQQKFSALTAEMQTHPELYPARFVTKLGQIADGLESDISPEASAADIFKAINDAKQAIDTKIPWGKEIGGESADAISALKSLRSELKSSLENEAVWGEAGARTSAYNNALSDFLTDKKEFQKRFMYKVQTRSGGVSYKVDPVKVNSFFNMINEPRGERAGDALTGFFKSSRGLVDEMEKTYQSSDFEKFDKSQLQGLLEKNEAMATRAQNVVSQQPGRGFGFFTDMLLGHTIGGPATAALKVAGSLLDPYAAVNRLSNLERSAQKTSAAIAKASSAVYSKTDAASKLIGPVSGEMTKEADQARYETRTDEIQKRAAPEHLLDKLELATRDLYHVAPNISSSMQMAAIRGTQYLQSKIPQPTSPPMPLDPPFQPTTAQVISFNRSYDAVHRPLTLVKELAAGTIHKETLEAVAAVYPKLFSEIKQEALSGLTSAIAKKASVAYQKRLALGKLLGSPVDSSMSPASVQANQQVLRGMAQKKDEQEAKAINPTAKGLGNLTLSGRLMTNMQDSAQRERS